MLRSLNSSVSGMKGFQNKLDVIGNNIANVNTVGFKKSRIVFQDVLSQTVSSGTTPTANSGGTNPLQIGLGVKTATVDSIQTPGSPTTTNLSSDLYIDGNGFFAVKSDSGSTYLTRAGNFNRDANGDLVTPQGNKVLGFKIDPADDSYATDPEPINIDSTRFVSYNIDLNGVVTGVMADGTPEKIAALGTVVVSNPAGLKKVGGSMYELTGSAQINADFTIPKVETLITTRDKNNAGQIVSGQLEMSNVDLSEEITEMIIAQRGFQANAKVINVSDSILEELINLKR
ncbi:flagellar hook protein FlgE [Neobacillus bataviensis LMG 21833]|uniref:Flagellar hook protein FlgE n=1 Tax=Neobacillus bataviensis LMG 21833 TaxID=1117379 RepID=K6D8S5_9BACI|nr:flagellar hook-basal body complex protein [Neobacillus bataviensis]EKN64719.1 flagellar hook protein FlgE [Neobacillus bataviensis LMG 21833]